MRKITLVMFNKKAEFEEIKDFYFEGGKAYEAWEQAEEYGKKYGLYGHDISSFNSYDFTEYEDHEAFKRQLKRLGWSFNGEYLRNLSY